MSPRLIFGVVSLLLVASVAIHAEIQPDFLMDDNPKLVLPDPVNNFNPALKGVWIQALKRPETDLQRMAAETISVAHQRGYPDLIETVPALETVLTAESSHPVARFAAARALIVLESRGSSDKLLKASQEYGADLRLLVEPTLAEWNVSRAKAIWIDRLSAPDHRRRDLILAIRSLGQTREFSALPQLKSLVLDLPRGPDVRLEAASAVGQLADAGLEDDAAVLCRSKSSIVNRLCAIRLLARHENNASRQLLIELAVDAEPSVAAAALGRLNEIDPSLVLPLAEAAMKNADPLVRQQGASAYLSRPNPERIGSVTVLLDDAHPEVRKQVREGLYPLAANPDLNEPIRSAAMKVLSGDRWKGQEQASLLLGALEHRPASMRLVELLESPREEVMVASAWALRKVADRQTIAAILDKAGRQTIVRRSKVSTALDLQVAHLFEACGRMRASEAIPLMNEYIPKRPPMGERSRGAAIWALGWIHEGTPNKSHGDAFLGRIMDYDIYPLEFPLIKQQSAISLGRMKHVEHAAELRKLLSEGTPNTKLGLALRWAVKELTGEEMPPPVPDRLGPGVWFLDLLPPRETSER